MDIVNIKCIEDTLHKTILPEIGVGPIDTAIHIKIFVVKELTSLSAASLCILCKCPYSRGFRKVTLVTLLE
jgi:hypothetical protein